MAWHSSLALTLSSRKRGNEILRIFTNISYLEKSLSVEQEGHVKFKKKLVVARNKPDSILDVSFTSTHILLLLLQVNH